MATIPLKRDSNAGGGKYQPLPEGTYRAKVSNVEEVNDKYGGVKVTLKIVGGGEQDGQTHNFRLFIGTEALNSLLETAGYETEGKDAVNVDFNDLIGLDVKVGVTVQAKGNKTYSNIKSFSPAPAAKKAA